MATAKPDIREYRRSWSLSIRPSLREAIEEIARKENNNPSRIVERAIQRFLDTQEPRTDTDTDTDKT
jgi:predicted transcriptional regulator